VRKIPLLALLLLGLGEPAFAQSGIFVSGSVFADHKRLSGDAADETLNATTAGGGAGIGYQGSERWDVRGEVEVGGTTTMTQAIVPTVTAFESRTRNQITAVSALAGYSPGTGARVRFTVLAGISFLHVETEFDSVPSGLVVVPHTDIDNVVSPTVGVEVPIVLGSHFRVVPALRVTAFTLQTSGMNGFALRPAVAVRWVK